MVFTLAFGIWSWFLGGGGVAVKRLQCGGVVPAAQPFAAAGGAAFSCSFPPLSLCEQTRSFTTGEVSELLPVLSVQLQK